MALFVALLLSGVMLNLSPVAGADSAIGCSGQALIKAINVANAHPEADLINLALGCTYTLTSVDNTVDGANGLPVISTPITIVGNAAVIERSSVQGAAAFRIFDIIAGGNLILANLTVRNGLASNGNSGHRTARVNAGGAIYINPGGMLTLNSITVSGNSAGGSGGGIDNFGTLILNESLVTDNSASFTGGGIRNETLGVATLTNSAVNGSIAANPMHRPSNGGGIFNAAGGTLTLRSSTVSGNQAGFTGGGIYNKGDSTLTGSTISGNTASNGGGLHNDGNGMLTLTNSTVSGNLASHNGAGIYSANTLKIVSSTITGNTADSEDDGYGDGGGIYVVSGTAVIESSIVAGNFDTLNNVRLETGYPDLYGNFSSTGFNLIGSSVGSIGFTDGIRSDHVGTNVSPINPLLGPLANNGGLTKTHMPQPSSAAVDAGGLICSPTDQRGVPRPRPEGKACDIGAVEVTPSAPNNIRS